MKRTTRFSIILVLALVTSACATLFNSGVKTVSLGSEPAGAEVLINGITRGTTPVSLDLNNHETHIVVFRREGYRDTTCTLTSSVGAKWVVLDVLFGLVPVIIDAATGAWKGIDQGACNVNMVPANELARDHGWVEFEPNQ